MRKSLMLVLVLIGHGSAAQQAPNPRQQPGATITMFAPDQHDLYDGHYVMSANRIYMVGGLNDPEGWDHMDNAAATVKPVAGTAEIDVNDLTNTGKFEVRAEDSRRRSRPRHRSLQRIQPVPERRHRRLPARARHRLGLRRQQLAEDVRVSGRMGIRPRDAQRQAAVPGLRDALHDHAGHPRSKDAAGGLPDAPAKKGLAGEVNPAAQQIDFYIRSPQQNPKNKPNALQVVPMHCHSGCDHVRPAE